MEYIPDDTGKNAGESTLSFDSFDGGGPDFTVRLSDESLVTYQYKTRYASSDHGEMTGAGYSVIFTFSGLKKGETEMVIEERSPIADNLDHHYKLCVDAKLNVVIEEGDVTEPGAEDE